MIGTDYDPFGSLFSMGTGLLAQAPPPTAAPPPAPGFSPDGFLSSIVPNLGVSLINVFWALVALLIGWLIATIAAAVTRGILQRTQIDNQLAAWISGSGDGESLPIEKWVADAVFWLIMLFAIVAFLQTLQLTAVSQPLNSLLEQITRFIPKLAAAAILLGVAWVIATIVKLLVTRTTRMLRLDERLGQQVASPDGETETPATPPQNQFLVTDTLANALYWFIFLLFLPSILSTLELEGTLQPVQQLLNNILLILPNIFGAILIAAAGWLIAQVVRRIVTNLLAATGTDQIGRRFGLSQATSGQSLSSIIGTVVYVLILIPTAIAALNTLKIDAISVPAVAMLTQILNAIPQIFTAILIVGLAYVIGQYVKDLVTNILTSLGFNNIFHWLGLQPRPARTGDVTVIQGSPPAVEPLPTRTPSELVGIIALVGVLLVATVAATDVLNIPALTAIVTGIVTIAGRILAGLVVFAIGLYLANLAFTLITSSGNRQARILAQTARIAIIALVSAMALQQMGIASNIVNLAFGLLLGAVAVAIALAFGLGGRDVAAEQLREWLASFKERS